MSVLTEYNYMNEEIVPDQLKCPKCKRPFWEPVTLANLTCVCRACVGSSETWTPVTEPIVLSMLGSIPVQCTRCGESNLLRGNFDNHMLNQCVKATVLCTAADIKCPWLGTRGELDGHKETCKYESMRPVLGFLFQEQRELNQRIAALENTIRTLRS